MQNFHPMLAFPSWKASAILALGGCNLVLIQWVMVRELTALLMGTELVALFVTASAFAGYSVGYLLSTRLSDRTLRLFAAITLPLHLTLPIVYRLIIGSLATMGSYRLGFLLLLAVTPFAVSAFYSLFLPRFVDARGSLIRLYSIELAGSALGVLLLPLVGGRGLPVLYIPYTLILALIVALVGVPRLWVMALAIAGAIWIALLPTLDARSNAYVFQSVQKVEGAETLASVYSPYQKVDVLRDSDGDLYLYLNGLMDYGSGGLKRFNVILSGVPAQMVRPQQMVIVGSGSMASVSLPST
jgi:predicted membrane-bound spermidine synthase